MELLRGTSNRRVNSFEMSSKDPFSTPARRRRIVASLAKQMLKNYCVKACDNVYRMRVERRSAILMQCWIRCSMAKIKVRRIKYIKRKNAATKIQSIWRRKLAMKKLKQLKIKKYLRNATRLARLLQREWRSKKERMFRAALLLKRKTAKEKMKNQAAIKIQQNIRGIIARNLFKALLEANRILKLKKLNAAVLVQKRIRVFQAIKLKERLLLERKAQKIVKCSFLKWWEKIKKKKEISAVKIQQAIRVKNSRIKVKKRKEKIQFERINYEQRLISHFHSFPKTIITLSTNISSQRFHQLKGESPFPFFQWMLSSGLLTFSEQNNFKFSKRVLNTINSVITETDWEEPRENIFTSWHDYEQFLNNLNSTNSINNSYIQNPTNPHITIPFIPPEENMNREINHEIYKNSKLPTEWNNERIFEKTQDLDMIMAETMSEFVSRNSPIPDVEPDFNDDTRLQPITIEDFKDSKISVLVKKDKDNIQLQVNCSENKKKDDFNIIIDIKTNSRENEENKQLIKDSNLTITRIKPPILLNPLYSTLKKVQISLQLIQKIAFCTWETPSPLSPVPVQLSPPKTPVKSPIKIETFSPLVEPGTPPCFSIGGSVVPVSPSPVPSPAPSVISFPGLLPSAAARIIQCVVRKRLNLMHQSSIKIQNLYKKSKILISWRGLVYSVLSQAHISAIKIQNMFKIILAKKQLKYRRMMFQAELDNIGHNFLLDEEENWNSFGLYVDPTYRTENKNEFIPPYGRLVFLPNKSNLENNNNPIILSETLRFPIAPPGCLANLGVDGNLILLNGSEDIDIKDNLIGENEGKNGDSDEGDKEEEKPEDRPSGSDQGVGLLDSLVSAVWEEDDKSVKKKRDNKENQIEKIIQSSRKTGIDNLVSKDAGLSYQVLKPYFPDINSCFDRNLELNEGFNEGKNISSFGDLHVFNDEIDKNRWNSTRNAVKKEKLEDSVNISRPPIYRKLAKKFKI